MLMKRLLDVIYSYIASHVDPAEYAADILQETMLSAWNGLKNFDSRSSFKTWVFSIARRKIADRYRMYHRNAAARLSELEDVLPLEGEYEHIDSGNDVKAAMAMLDRVEKEIVFLTGRIGEKMGEAVGSFYRQLVESGIPQEEALRMARDYMLSLKDITGAIRNDTANYK